MIMVIVITVNKITRRGRKVRRIDEETIKLLEENFVKIWLMLLLYFMFAAVHIDLVGVIIIFNFLHLFWLVIINCLCGF